MFGTHELDAENRLARCLSTQQLAHFRHLLENKRNEVLHELIDSPVETRDEQRSNRSTGLSRKGGEAISGQSNLALALGQIESGHRLLSEIEAAMARIDAGTYGTCDMTSKPIPLARLYAIPWARCRIEGALQLEDFPKS